MSADRSPAFNPPLNRIIDSDPMIVSVGNKKETDWAARRSAQPDVANSMNLKQLPNGK